LKVAVCVKQVPQLDAVAFNPETNTIRREGVLNELNPYDRRGIAQALALKEQLGAEVVVITMGPPQAADVLRGALAVGADRAIHLCDPAFAGADTLATARALAAVIRRERADLVLCGRNSLDADTGQVGPELAELLDVPQVTNATSLRIEDGGTRAILDRETDDGIETIEVRLPAVITAGERLIRGDRVPSIPEGDVDFFYERWGTKLQRFPLSPDMRVAAQAKPLEVRTAADLGLDSAEVGSQGSPTSVDGVFAMGSTRSPIVISGDDPARAGKELVDHLRRRLRLDGDSPPALEPLPDRPTLGDPCKAIWVVVEQLDGEIREATFELLGASARLAQQLGGQAAAVLLGYEVQQLVPALAASGADTVYVADDKRLDPYLAETFSQVLTEAINRFRPWAVLAPATAMGRDYLPRVAARLNLGLTGDAIGLELDGRGLCQIKPAFGGSVAARVYSRTLPHLVTVRPGAVAPCRPDMGRRAAVIPLPPPPALAAPRSAVLACQRSAGTGGIELDHASRVVCAGAGIGGPTNLHYVESLAAALGAAVGATRRVADAGWLPRQQQIGVTGKFISPQLYVGVAVSGEFTHTAGIRGAGTIVAINHDPDAPIFEQADLGIVGDYRQVVPALIAELKRLDAAALV